MGDKKCRFEVREIDAWFNEEEGWWYNATYKMGEFSTKAKDERKAFTGYLKRKHGITFKKNRTRIEFDGDNYEIVDRKTGEPLFFAAYIMEV